MTRGLRKIRFGWILLAAFVAEIVGIAGVMGIRVIYGHGPTEIVQLPPLGETLFLLELATVSGVAGWWVSRRKARYRRVLNGLLVGVSAVVLYEVLTVGAPIPRLTWSHLATHVVKIAGAWIGGWLGARKGNETSVAPMAIR